MSVDFHQVHFIADSFLSPKSEIAGDMEAVQSSRTRAMRNSI